MIKVLKAKFKAGKKTIDRLFECNRISGQIWNDCVKIAKEFYEQTKKWISKTELQKRLKRKYPMHSQSIQAVVHKYIQARNAARLARAKGYKNIRYPYKTKNNFPTKWAKDGFKVYENGKIELSKGTWEGKQQEKIIVYVKKLPPGTIKEIELIWDNGLFLAISFEDGKEQKNNSDKTIAAIDMGEIHSIAAVDQAGEAIIITARELRSIKRLRNKKHKDLKKRISRLKKGSRKWKKLKRAMRKTSSKTQAQQKDILHKTSCQFVKWAQKGGIGTVVIGDVEGVQRNTSSRKKNNPKKKRRSRKVNQKISQWPFGLLITYLTYKLAAVGIEVVKRSEEYTSQTCPVCDRRKKVSGRVYKCYCGYKEHRDVHGARNILSLHLYGEIKDTKIEIQNIKYLRPAS